MAETTADVRRDIEMTRERMSATLSQLEQKLNVAQVVRDHPWPAIALAVGAGIALSASRTDVKAAAATVAATQGAGSKVGTLLDDLVANLVTGATEVLQSRMDSWVNEVKVALGASAGSTSSQGNGRSDAARQAGATGGQGTQPGISGNRMGSGGAAGWGETRAD